ncbi:unnamed protein product [Rotaria sp. Silwood2]|nr:unnamed protein product [Rotaria sp. Silwood2]
MTETKKSKLLTHEQLEAILKTDHIREHLIKVGLINHRGDIIPKDEYRHRTRRRHTSNKNLYYKTSASHHPSVTSTVRRPKENISNTNEQDRPQPPNYNSTDRKLKSTSSAQPKQTNKAPLSTRFSSSTWIENVRIMPADNRCFVTVRYFGDEINIDYNRSLFIPGDDEILVMQQHCGGENLIVFKGLLKPDEDFSFQSRRHTDYPFALAFYINGVINNRLSVCCENRCKDYMRIGGKRGLFAIRNIENCAPCRRCRFEQRMKKLMEGEPKPKPKRNRYRKPAESGTPSRQSSTSRETKSTLPCTESSQQTETNTGSPKPAQPNKTDSKTNGSLTFSTETNNKDHSKINRSPISSPIPTEPDNKDHSKTNGSPASSPKPTESDNRVVHATYSHDSSSEISDSPISSPKTNQFNEKDSKTSGFRISIPKTVDSNNEDHSETSESSTPRQKSIETSKNDVSKNNKPRMSSPESIKSDVSSVEEQHGSSSLTRIRPMTAPSNQRKATSSPNPSGADLEEVDDEIHSPLSTTRENDQIQYRKNNNLDRVSIVSSEKDDNEELATISDDSSTDYEETLASSNLHKNTDD